MPSIYSRQGAAEASNLELLTGKKKKERGEALGKSRLLLAIGVPTNKRVAPQNTSQTSTEKLHLANVWAKQSESSTPPHLRGAEAGHGAWTAPACGVGRVEQGAHLPPSIQQRQVWCFDIPAGVVLVGCSGRVSFHPHLAAARFNQLGQGRASHQAASLILGATTAQRDVSLQPHPASVFCPL